MEQTFKTVSEFIAHLESNKMSQEEIVANLKELTTRRTSGQRRGQLAGLTVDQMSDEQLKREIINANSVLYKAKQRNAAAETIEKNQARVDAALAEKAKRQPEAPAAEVTTEATTDEVYNSDVAAEL
jgi:hypothetical protein